MSLKRFCTRFRSYLTSGSSMFIYLILGGAVLKKIISLMLIVPLLAVSVLAAPAASELSSPSAILMEKSTGRILFEKDAHKKLPPASVTKIMTLLLIMEAIESKKLNLDDMISVSEHAASMGGSQVFLSPGEQMSVNDLLKATVIASGNDSAVALAESIAGSEAGFVELMNSRAKELGMEDTTFINCTGLDAEGHLTSAHDIAIMSQELIRHEKIKEYSTTWMDSLRNGAFTLANTNKLIRSYNGITGLKTGSTGNAKYCLSATAERDGMELIAAIMGAPSSKERFADAASLLNYGFANFALYDVGANIELSPVPILLGKCESIVPTLPEGSFVLTEKSKISTLTKNIELADDIKAPIEKGQTLGKIDVLSDGEIIQTVPLIAPERIKRIDFGGIFKKFSEIIFMK